MRPQNRVVINLAPADLPKQAASFDLPIALGILAGSGQIDAERLAEYAVVGELALDGTTRAAKGALSMAMAAAEMEGLRGLLVPSLSAAEAAVVEGIEVIPVSSLAQAVGVPHRRDRDRAARPRGSTSCSARSRPTKSTSPTSAARRWPSGR